MVKSVKNYGENLYQWIWEHLEFDCRQLKTVCGSDVQIIHPGELNTGAGPDFLSAKIRIGGLSWNGAVEIHKTAHEWSRHGHQHDARYNNVFLHVVFSDQSLASVTTLNGARPYTLCLKPHLNRALHRLAELKQESGLLCKGEAAFISQQAFERQVEIAHREYLGYKVTELLEAYPAGVPISKAWKTCFITRLYSTLGIPANREPMLKLAAAISEQYSDEYSPAEFQNLVESEAFSQAGTYNWVHSGMRPASRPGVRVRQAAALHYAVQKLPFSAFIDPETNAWKQCIKQLPEGSSPGAQMVRILKQTVYVPARYLLGELLQSKALTECSCRQWQAGGRSLPAEIIRPFEAAGFSVKGPAKKLGLAHHYKRYCKERKCHQCKVFKNAIGS